LRLLVVTLTLSSLAGPQVASGLPIRPPLAAASTLETTTGNESLETAATRATDLGRTVALSLIGLALAVAGVVMVFRRNFREAVGVMVVGGVAVLLASPAGLTVLQSTVSLLFGSG
jgi:hypothetical protein